MFAHDTNLVKLYDEIQIKREEMIQVANEYGYTNVKTVKCSQELDKLITKYQILSVKQQYNVEITGSFFRLIFFIPKSTYKPIFMI